MAGRVELIIDPARREKLSLRLPLESRVPPEEARRSLGLPPTIDLSDPIVAKAVGLLDAARRADPPVRIALFGGTAHRLRCPTSNDRALGLRHELHDLDIAVLSREIRAVQQFLRSVADREGSALTFFETSGDRIYNSLSGGQRLRWHMVTSQEGTEIVLGTLDLVADEFRFCHRFDVRADVEGAAASGGTLSLARLLLAKSQFIREVPREDSALVADRMLEPFGKRSVVIGPEAKDVRDILALVIDHPVGEGTEAISAEALRAELVADWGLWKTVGLNLEMVARSKVLAGLPDPVHGRAEERLRALRDLVASLRPKRRFGLFGGAWWQEVDSTPSVDSTVGVS